jgi:hypothetical protein
MQQIMMGDPGVGRTKHYEWELITNSMELSTTQKIPSCFDT